MLALQARKTKPRLRLKGYRAPRILFVGALCLLHGLMGCCILPVPLPRKAVRMERADDPTGRDNATRATNTIIDFRVYYFNLFMNRWQWGWLRE